MRTVQGSRKAGPCRRPRSVRNVHGEVRMPRRFAPSARVLLGACGSPQPLAVYRFPLASGPTA